ncbi:MAG TPA: hypothetical protein DHV85_21760 [Candidatus Accumulibacter sp.]|nr:hypothetical protein [Accumulibacter sp.]
MSLASDLLFALKPRCPVCRQGRLFREKSLAVVEACESCGAALGDCDVGDGASVFLIFILGFLLVPLAWGVEAAFAPPLWVHALVWGALGLAITMVALPAVKAYIVLLEFRHRRG